MSCSASARRSRMDRRERSPTPRRKLKTASAMRARRGRRCSCARRRFWTRSDQRSRRRSPSHPRPNSCSSSSPTTPRSSDARKTSSVASSAVRHSGTSSSSARCRHCLEVVCSGLRAAPRLSIRTRRLSSSAASTYPSCKDTRSRKHAAAAAACRLAMPRREPSEGRWRAACTSSRTGRRAATKRRTRTIRASTRCVVRCTSADPR
mmetsp:Transcript_11934/g.31599  ORF Transcript_11934/g.31599 Transcript_11934/m.31599 type:complete len:206 (+) Transcript_11934:997-1614(+)